MSSAGSTSASFSSTDGEGVIAAKAHNSAEFVERLGDLAGKEIHTCLGE